MNSFKKAQDNQNIQTDKILYRMDLERPFALREKICMLGADNEGFKDKNHSLQKFNQMKRYVERKRMGRRKKNNINNRY